MKISNQTLQVLKNYASINPNLLVQAGNVLTTISVNKNIFATAQVEESFPTSFAIYDLQQFLGIISIFDDPEFVFNESSVVIKSGNKSIEYMYAAPELIISPSEGIIAKIAVSNPEVVFNLSSQNLNEIQKATSILQLESINVVSSDGKVSVVVADPKNPSSNKFSVEVDGQSTSNIDMVFGAESLKLIPGDYSVSISSSGISSFSNSKLNIKYFVMASTPSKKKV